MALRCRESAHAALSEVTEVPQQDIGDQGLWERRKLLWKCGRELQLTLAIEANALQSYQMAHEVVQSGGGRCRGLCGDRGCFTHGVLAYVDEKIIPFIGPTLPTGSLPVFVWHPSEQTAFEASRNTISVDANMHAVAVGVTPFTQR